MSLRTCYNGRNKNGITRKFMGRVPWTGLVGISWECSTERCRWHQENYLLQKLTSGGILWLPMTALNPKLLLKLLGRSPFSLLQMHDHQPYPRPRLSLHDRNDLEQNDGTMRRASLAMVKDLQTMTLRIPLVAKMMAAVG